MTILQAIRRAIATVTQRRFYVTERGYQGCFGAALQIELGQQGLLSPPLILEQEHQKTLEIHGISQRPDMVLHVPREESGGPVTILNKVVFALKKRASQSGAASDFMKLDEICRVLHYELAVFINIASEEHWLSLYQGLHKQKIHAFCTNLRDGQIRAKHAWFSDEGLIEERFESDLGM